MASVIQFIIQTYEEWKADGSDSSFSSNNTNWSFSSNVIGDNIIISSDNDSKKHRFIIQNKSTLLYFLNDYFKKK